MPHPTCTVPKCGRDSIALELCTKHYQRLRKTGTTDDPVPLTPEQRRANNLASKARHRERNREAIRAYDRARRAANLERERARCRAYGRRNRARLNAYMRTYHQQNAARTAAKNRAWYARNRPWSAAKSAERRARMRATSTSRVDYRVVIARHGMVCHLCRGRIRGRAELHIDHVVALARGGTHTYDNLRPAHAYCNRSKGARPVRRVVRPYDLAG